MVEELGIPWKEVIAEGNNLPTGDWKKVWEYGLEASDTEGYEIQTVYASDNFDEEHHRLRVTRRESSGGIEVLTYTQVRRRGRERSGVFIQVIRIGDIINTIVEGYQHKVNSIGLLTGEQITGQVVFNPDGEVVSGSTGQDFLSLPDTAIHKVDHRATVGALLEEIKSPSGRRITALVSYKK